MVCNWRISTQEKKQAMEKLVKEGKAQWHLVTNRDFSHVRDVFRGSSKCLWYDKGFPVVYKDRKRNGIQFYRVLVKDRKRGG